MKVLVTGGAGYIGSHCNLYLQNAGIDTVVLDDLSFGHEAAVLKGLLVRGDIGDRELLDRLFHTHCFDAVLHFAALADVADSVARPGIYEETNVKKMEILLQAMMKYGVQRMVFSSTAAVYGNPAALPILEEHPLEPINPYGATKLKGERLLQRFEREFGLRHVSLRYFNAAGADPLGRIGESHQPEHHLIPLMLQACLYPHCRLKIFGTDYETKDGTCLRDFIHVMDLAEAHSLALKHLIDGGASECFNLGSGTGHTIMEMVHACELVTGCSVPCDKSDRRPGDPAVLLASHEKIEAHLGWKPRFSQIEEIIRTAWEWEKRRRF